LSLKPNQDIDMSDNLSQIDDAHFDNEKQYDIEENYMDVNFTSPCKKNEFPKKR